MRYFFSIKNLEGTVDILGILDARHKNCAPDISVTQYKLSTLAKVTSIYIYIYIYTMTLLNAATFTLKLITNPVLTLTLLTNDAHGNETLFGITHHVVRTLRQTLHEISYCSSTNIFHRTTDYTLYSTDIPSMLAIVVAITWNLSYLSTTNTC